MIFINFAEELVQFGVWYCKTSLFEGTSQLALIHLAILVSVDGVEQREELLFGSFNKCAEF